MTTKRIELTQGQYAIVDAADYDSLSQFKWCAAYYKKWKFFRAVRGVKKGGKLVTTYMHRVIMDAPTGMVVDHINHNPLDNRRSNLRICTHKQNTQNKRKSSLASSKFKGVTWYIQTKRWVATIHSNGCRRHLGYYKCEIEAAKAYDQAALELFGEFAHINNPG